MANPVEVVGGAKVQQVEVEDFGFDNPEEPVEVRITAPGTLDDKGIGPIGKVLTIPRRKFSKNWMVMTEDEVVKPPADDLKMITGIGKALEERLVKGGISTFEMIATLTEDEVQELDDELELGGRVAREDWVGQAQALLTE